jgi:hypothetical protein
MMHDRFESKIDKTMDTILEKPKTEFQTNQKDTDALIECCCTAFDSHIEVFINNHTGNPEGSTLQYHLALGFMEATMESATDRDLSGVVNVAP